MNECPLNADRNVHRSLRTPSNVRLVAALVLALFFLSRVSRMCECFFFFLLWPLFARTSAIEAQKTAIGQLCVSAAEPYECDNECTDTETVDGICVCVLAAQKHTEHTKMSRID